MSSLSVDCGQGGWRYDHWFAPPCIHGDIRLQLTSLHGDIAATIALDPTTLKFYDYDEFGVPRNGQADLRYGWLGGKQRSGDALGDIILMGVRLYSMSLGRLLQIDPTDGGNANAYDYCIADPINCFDLDGRFGWRRVKSCGKAALNNGLVRGVAAGVVVGALCVGDLGIGCAVAVGAIAGGVLGAHTGMCTIVGKAGRGTWRSMRPLARFRVFARRE